MKAHLIKVDDIYRLINDNNSIIGTTDLEYQKAFSDVCFLLSTKNCEAIENGYDLDELAEGEAKKIHDWNKHKYTDILYNKLVVKDAELIKIGFKKALEILGDKKFSVGDIQNFIDNENPGQYPYIALQLKQKRNKWDVEIEMEDAFIKNSDQYIDEVGVGNYSTHTKKPKLDSDGCLILKRK